MKQQAPKITRNSLDKATGELREAMVSFKKKEQDVDISVNEVRSAMPSDLIAKFNLLVTNMKSVMEGYSDPLGRISKIIYSLDARQTQLETKINTAVATVIGVATVATIINLIISLAL